MKLQILVEQGIKAFSSQDFDGALSKFKKALEIARNSPTCGIVYYNIGLCHFEKQNFIAAEKSFRQSLYWNYNHAKWELCLSLLHQKKIEGLAFWDGRYLGERRGFPDLPIRKISTLEELSKTKKLLVLNEQGFGDEFLFSRGLDLLDGKDHSYQIYEETLELFRTNFNSNFFVERTLSRDFVNSHDAWIPSGDLFKLSLERGLRNFPSFSKNDKKTGVQIPVIGICWFCNGASKNHKKRSIDISIIRGITQDWECEWVCLQKGSEIEFGSNPRLESFLETSSVIDNLDLVLTVDTSVAHLAAIKRKKTILLWDKYLDWRWKFNFYGDHVQVININDLPQQGNLIN